MYTFIKTICSNYCLAIILLLSQNVRIVKATATTLAVSGCSMLNYCNGHGECVETTQKCNCFEGWGATGDIMFYKAPDCSVRSCPAGISWGDVPSATDTAHKNAECSGRGKCVSGICDCAAGYEGGACERIACPKDCSGHGVCVSMKNLAQRSDALPLSSITTYEGAKTKTTWDQEKLFACICDSSWSVGLGANKRQEPEWYSNDCSLRHCPSGDDPRTTSTDETDCGGKAAKDSTATGDTNNKCQVDCANRGKCDTSTGICNCFNQFYGQACSSQITQFSSISP